jgi:cytoskeleton protein RodZ
VIDATQIEAGAAPATRLTPGELLRAARERAGWTTERLAAELCLPLDRMRALERDDHASFGGAVYVRGYLRRTALLLDVSPQEIIAAYEAGFTGAKPAEVVPGLPPGKPPRRGPPGWIGPLAGAVAVAGVIASTWWVLGPHDAGVTAPEAGVPKRPATLEFTTPEEPRVARIEQLPVEAAPEVTVQSPDPAEGTLASAVVADEHPTELSIVEAQASVPLPPGTVELRFEFREDCWLEVTDAEDRSLAYRLHRAGDVVRLRGTAPVSVFLGNAEGVRLTVDGTEVPLRTARRDGTARLTVGGGAG